MKKLISMLLINILVAATAQAQLESAYANHQNYFSSGIRVDETLGGVFTLGYERALTPNLKMGVIIGTGQSVLDSSESGDSSVAQFYREEFRNQSNIYEITTSYYFKDFGASEWGFFLRGGIGYANSTTKAQWKRYDDDPGFIIIGDGKRLLESGSDEKKWGSGYAKVLGFYQFVWNFAPGARVGHVLELGLGASYLGKKESFSYIKPNGQSYSKETKNFNTAYEINYAIAF